MEFTANPAGPAMIVGLAGNLDVAAAQPVTDFLNGQMEAGHVKLVADLSQLTYVSSAGLRVLLAAVKEARRQGGDVRLAAVRSEDVNKVLRMSGFSNILRVYPDTAAAVASFAEQANPV